MNPKITTLTAGTLTLTAALAGCGNKDAAPAPTTSTASQHISGGNDPRYQQGIDAWLAFGKLIPSDGKHMPAEASKYATQRMIDYQNTTQDNWFGGKTTFGKVKKFKITSHQVSKHQGLDIYLNTPTQPYQMTVRVCDTTKAELTNEKGTNPISASGPATLYFKSSDKGKTWKLDEAAINAPSSVKLGCESASPSPSSSTSQD